MAETARSAFDRLDRTMHEKARLAILTSLAGHPDGLGFAELKQLCRLTDGNLSRHLQVLEEAGLVAVSKGYRGKRPHTNCRLTAEGRQRFAQYLEALEAVLKDARTMAEVNRRRTAQGGEQPA